MSARVVRILALSILIVGAGCKGKPTIETIEGWIRAGQFTKVQEFVAASENPMELRIRTIQKLVEYGLPTEVQNVMDGVKDRDEFVAESVKTLLDDLDSGEKAVQIESKDALFILMNFLEAEQKDKVLAAVAAWAFEGLDESSKRDDLVKRIEEYRMIGQLNRMDEHGLPVAAWLVSYGVETHTLQSYLAEAKDPKSQMIVIAAIKKLFSMENLVIPWEILDISRAFKIPQTVEFLVDVYLNDGFPDAARSSALAAAQDLVYGIGEKAASVHDTAEKKKTVLAALRKLIGSDLATDRWDAADMLLHVGGPTEVASIVDGLKDNLYSYARFTPEEEIEFPDYVIIQMCSRQLKPRAARVRPILEDRLKAGDPVQKAFAILCLKVLGEPASVDKLKEFVESTDSLEAFFFSKEERARRRPLIEAETDPLPQLTIGLLAQNAIDGIDMLQTINAALADKKMPEKEAELRALSAVSVIGFAGEQYKVAVEQTYQKKASKPEEGAEDAATDGSTDNSTDAAGGSDNATR